MCRNGGFPDYPDQYSAAKITAAHGDKVHFYDDDVRDGCPDNKAVCQSKISLKTGDSVLVAQEKNGWSCVWHFGKKGLSPFCRNAAGKNGFSTAKCGL